MTDTRPDKSPTVDQSQKDNNDFVSLAKNKLTSSVDLFIDENQGYTPDKKEQSKKSLKKLLTLL